MQSLDQKVLQSLCTLENQLQILLHQKKRYPAAPSHIEYKYGHELIIRTIQVGGDRINVFSSNGPQQ